MAKRKAVDEATSHSHTATGTSIKHSHATPSPAKRKRYEEDINKINAMEPADFRKHYITTKSLHYSTRRTGDAKEFIIIFQSADKITKIELDSCFRLIESTSRPDYESSSWGWHPKRKKREMKENEMRYLLVRSAGDEGNPVLGFLSFMLTHDSTPSVPVLYIYEIHLSRALQGLGLGAHLMDLAEKIAENVAVEKVMLTCFLSNENAHSFYKKRGYVADVCSPEDRRTRNKVVKPDYVIMSKDVLGSSANAALDVRVANDVREGLQHGGERAATDSAPIHVTERRTDVKHKGRTNTGETSSYNHDGDASASGKGWPTIFRRVFSGNKENLHEQRYWTG
jgi:GNAT superfamily N-acetyltransferase